MKIKGKDWMDWLHQVRRESQKQRKSNRRSLATHLRTLEGKTTSKGVALSELTRTSQSRAKSR
jgi:hypothetical protein